MIEVRVRFAPSPTGIPHIGNTRTAFFNWLFARHYQGKFILRIEDTDRQRLVPESLPKILEILRWLGISWDEGPYVQSERLSIYKEIAQKLIEQGTAYYCFCTPDRLEKMRQEQQAKKQIPRYDRTCLRFSKEAVEKKLKAGEPHVIRLKVPDSGETSWEDLVRGKISFQNNQIDDQVLLKSDGYPTYHLAVSVDDYLMKISHVLRGVEWISSTPKHLLLYQALGWQLPQIGHFPLILGPDRAKLSKRHGAKSALDYRDEGYLKEALLNFMLLLGWAPKDNQEVFDLEEMIKRFDLDGIQKANAIFNIQKLDWFNGVYIRQKPDDELVQLTKPFVPKGTNDSLINQTIPLVKERLVKLSDYSSLAGFFFEEPKVDKKIFETGAKEQLTKAQEVLNKVKRWEKTELEESLQELVKQEGWSMGQFFMNFRIAITGSRTTPPITDSIAILGREKTLKRLKII